MIFDTGPPEPPPSEAGVSAFGGGPPTANFAPSEAANAALPVGAAAVVGVAAVVSGFRTIGPCPEVRDSMGEPLSTAAMKAAAEFGLDAGTAAAVGTTLAAPNEAPGFADTGVLAFNTGRVTGATTTVTGAGAGVTTTDVSGGGAGARPMPLRLPNLLPGFGVAATTVGVATVATVGVGAGDSMRCSGAGVGCTFCGDGRLIQAASNLGAEVDGWSEGVGRVSTAGPRGERPPGRGEPFSLSGGGVAVALPSR